MSGRRDIIEEDDDSGGSNRVLVSMAHLLEHLVDQSSQGTGQSTGRMSSHEDPQERFRRQRPQEFSVAVFEASAVAQSIQSTWIPRRKKRRSSEAWQTDARFSRSDEPAAKQLTIYEEFTRAGCQLLSSIQMAKATRRNQRSRWKDSMAKI
ncbi:hypothetical protein F511_30010 [Dorcoceras hygrometricum]|uniref:Uncharacterized protein n=1 Tax=Dorcoceras hygrometricum TaxID=472368 RepID=A0A2Z7BMU6_9LAMI|nr:hypothetical protein F511_30010 [Dorcoceras hygrometricum]